MTDPQTDPQTGSPHLSAEIMTARYNTHTLFSDKADLYAQNRPMYPLGLFAHIMGLFANDTLKTLTAWDVATGNGQAALDLATFCQHVEATDVSAEQIQHALVYNPRTGQEMRNIRYRAQPAEKTDFADASMDLITVAQALHWFDYAQFWPEVLRVLRPQGVFATWGYSWSKIHPEIDAAIDAHLLSALQPYWAKQNQLLWNQYQDIPWPAALVPVATPAFAIEMHWTLEQLFGYFHTWSATRRCMDAQGDGFFQAAKAALVPIWERVFAQPATLPATVRIPLVVWMGRKG